jgi:hypothetical protein
MLLDSLLHSGLRRKHHSCVSTLLHVRNLLPSSGRYLHSHYLATAHNTASFFVLRCFDFPELYQLMGWSNNNELKWKKECGLIISFQSEIRTGQLEKSQKHYCFSQRRIVNYMK